MPNYTLTAKNEIRAGSGSISEVASNRVEALAIFSKQLRELLTLEDQGGMPQHFMDEWQSQGSENPHWTNPTIPVWAIKHV